MLEAVIHYGLDVWGFAIVSVSATLGLHLWLKRRERGGLSPAVRVSTLTIIALAVLAAKLAGAHERTRLRDQLIGFAPTYAAELELMGHEKINASTPVDDPAYLKMIAAQIRWERANPNVADIYTFRKDDAGKIHLIVDSETDYDHNGVFEGERESRTAIGETYEPSAGFLEALDGITCFDENPQSDRWGTWVTAYVPLRGSDGKVEAALGVDYDAGQWDAAIEWNRAGALGLAGLLLAVTLSASSVVTIGRAELNKRERLQRQLVDASRQAGMAEVATGVLHNVGNVLNGVNVSADVLTERVRNSKIDGVARAAGLIREHDANLAAFFGENAKGRMLPDYLTRLSELLAAEQSGLLEELSSLGRSLQHVKQIVSSQQTFARKIHVIETFELADLIDEALRLGVTAEDRAGVTIDVSQANGPSVTSDRHQILQVLTNLISNAVKAVRDSANKSVRVVVDEETIDGRPAVRVRVIDSGCGIDAATLPKLFTHGFTTRADGHGFGLHHSAIAAANLDGTLRVTSDGVGLGATFTLTLPLVPETKEGSLCKAA